MMYAKRYLLWTYTTAKPSLSNAGKAQQKRWMIGVVSFLAPLLILCGENTMMSLLLYKTNIGFGLAMVVMLHHSGVHVNMRTVAWSMRANRLPVRCRNRSQKAAHLPKQRSLLLKPRLPRSSPAMSMQKELAAQRLGLVAPLQIL